MATNVSSTEYGSDNGPICNAWFKSARHAWVARAAVVARRIDAGIEGFQRIPGAFPALV